MHKNLKNMKPVLKKIKIKASIVGASGYSGLELLKLLNNHKYVEHRRLPHQIPMEERLYRRFFPHLAPIKKTVKLPACHSCL